MGLIKALNRWVQVLCTFDCLPSVIEYEDCSRALCGCLQVQDMGLRMVAQGGKPRVPVQRVDQWQLVVD